MFTATTSKLVVTVKAKFAHHTDGTNVANTGFGLTESVNDALEDKVELGKIQRC